MQIKYEEKIILISYSGYPIQKTKWPDHSKNFLRPSELTTQLLHFQR